MITCDVYYENGSWHTFRSDEDQEKDYQRKSDAIKAAKLDLAKAKEPSRILVFYKNDNQVIEREVVITEEAK